MRVLIIKTSSLGDVIHTLPALTDAAHALPHLRFDWIVEEAFAEIPRWHPAVDRVIPIALRRWRKAPITTLRSAEWTTFRQTLAHNTYDRVIDAQGLFKSAWLTRLVTAPAHGLNHLSAREPLASLFYTHRHPVPWGQHAVTRVRTLFAHALGYTLPDTAANAHAYGIDRNRIAATADYKPQHSHPYLLFLHGTTWNTKHWPEHYWRQLAKRVVTTPDYAAYEIHLPWGNPAEHARAHRIAEGLPNVRVLPRLGLADIALELSGATACIATDTGLGHLAAALDIPTLSLFGPTNPGLTGAWGQQQTHLTSDFPCAPCLKKQCTHRPTPEESRQFNLTLEHPLCFTRVQPERVWGMLSPLLDSLPKSHAPAGRLSATDTPPPLNAEVS